MIKLEKVTKSYGHHKVLDDITFQIDGGEFVSLVGPSGAGKTTLVHALIGAETISKGKIQVDDFTVNQLKTKYVQDYRRKIGIIFQDFKLLPKKTVFENIAFALEVSGYPKDVIRTRTVQALKMAGLEEQRNHFPKHLSGGEKQRTAVARALVHAPELLIADEPTGNLDPENAIALAKLLLKVNQHGTTVILATHNKEIVDFLQQRVITLDRGKVVNDRKKAGYS